MFKKQMVFQRVVCILALVVAALVFVYSLGVMTDLYDCLYSTMMDPSDHYETDVPGSIVFYDMQPFNALFLKLSIVMILLSAVLFITNTHVRRKYYISNYIATGVFSVYTIAFVLWAGRNLNYYKAMWLAVDFEKLKEHAELWSTHYTDSAFWFDLKNLVFALCWIVVILLICNLVLKIKLEKTEDELVKGGK